MGIIRKKDLSILMLRLTTCQVLSSLTAIKVGGNDAIDSGTGDPIQLSDDNTTYHIEVKDGERPSIELCFEDRLDDEKIESVHYLRS